MKTTIRNGIIFMGLVLAGCGSNAATSSTGGVGAVAIVATLPSGATLYDSNCLSCHGPITSSTKIGADSSRIQNAISSNAGGMGFLATLAVNDVQAIATALAPVPIGATLYQSDCLGCHAGLSTTVKAGADSVRIQNAITGNVGGMGFLSTLTPLQVQAIASTLAVTSSGTALYGSNCAGCHGIIATSLKIGADSSRIQNAINNDVGGMGYLSTLAATDIQAIAAVLTAP